MADRVILHGATGRTGRLVLAELLARGRRPVLSGRDPARLEALAAEHGDLRVRIADPGRPSTLRALVEPGDVLIAAAGPFTRIGGPVAAAAARAGCVYLDCTGEPAFVRDVFVVHGPRARRAGGLMVPALGYDYAPGSAAAALAARRAGEDCTRIDVGYFVDRRRGGGVSRGTRRSAVRVALGDCFALRGGRLVRVAPGDRQRSFGAGGRSRRALSIGGAEPFALPGSLPKLRDVEVYAGFFGGRTPEVAAAARALAAVGRLPGAGLLLGRGGEALAGLGAAGSGDPDPGTARVVACAYDTSGRRLARVELAGGSPYALTAHLLAWAAARAAAERPEVSGAAGPVQAFGLDALLAACAERGLAEAAGPGAGAAAGAGSSHDPEGP